MEWSSPGPPWRTSRGKPLPSPTCSTKSPTPSESSIRIARPYRPRAFHTPPGTGGWGSDLHPPPTASVSTNGAPIGAESVPIVQKRRRLIEAGLRRLEAFARDRLHGIGGLPHQRIDLHLRLELREHEVRNRPPVAAPRAPDPNPQPEE